MKKDAYLRWLIIRVLKWARVQRTAQAKIDAGLDRPYLYTDRHVAAYNLYAYQKALNTYIDMVYRNQKLPTKFKRGDRVRVDSFERIAHDQRGVVVKIDYDFQRECVEYHVDHEDGKGLYRTYELQRV
jgi:hypothetical protein